MNCLLSEPIIQLHATTRCNLACAHCYSSSSPGDAPSLEPDVVVDALEVLAAEGYRVLSISGGEPFLYEPLVDIAQAATLLGYRVSVVTNGAAVSPAKARAIAPWVRTVAVSFDGRPERHDQIRGKRGAFELAERGARVLLDAGIRIGLISCVTRHSLADVPWLYERACQLEASLFQLRPLALTGRAATTLIGDKLDNDDVLRLVVVASLLANVTDGPLVQCDLASVADLTSTGRGQFPLLAESGGSRSLSELVNPLVVTETGAVRPFAYGLDQRWEITTVDDIAHGLWSGLDADTRLSLADLVQRSFGEVQQSGVAFVDWYSILTDVALSPHRPLSAGLTHDLEPVRDEPSPMKRDPVTVVARREH